MRWPTEKPRVRRINAIKYVSRAPAHNSRCMSPSHLITLEVLGGHAAEVSRELLAGADRHDIARNEVLSEHVLGLAVASDEDLLREELLETLHDGGGLGWGGGRDRDKMRRGAARGQDESGAEEKEGATSNKQNNVVKNNNTPSPPGSRRSNR